jgi:hypothetical protein
MGWCGQDYRDLANERDNKPHVVQRRLFASAVPVFIALWVMASFR